MYNVELLYYELEQAGLPVVGVSANGRVDYSRALTPTEQTTATAIISAHNPNSKLPWEQAAIDATAGYKVLPDWVKTATAQDVANYINNNVWSGSTKAQVNTWIDQNITGTNVSQLRTQVITALKLIAAAIIDLRDLMVIVSKLIIYLRDLIIRYRDIIR